MNPASTVNSSLAPQPSSKQVLSNVFCFQPALDEVKWTRYTLQAENGSPNSNYNNTVQDPIDFLAQKDPILAAYVILLAHGVPSVWIYKRSRNQSPSSNQYDPLSVHSKELYVFEFGPVKAGAQQVLQRLAVLSVSGDGSWRTTRLSDAPINIVQLFLKALHNRIEWSLHGKGFVRLQNRFIKLERDLPNSKGSYSYSFAFFFVGSMLCFHVLIRVDRVKNLLNGGITGRNIRDTITPNWSLAGNRSTFTELDSGAATGVSSFWKNFSNITCGQSDLVAFNLGGSRYYFPAQALFQLLPLRISSWSSSLSRFFGGRKQTGSELEEFSQLFSQMMSKNGPSDDLESSYWSWLRNDPLFLGLSQPQNGQPSNANAVAESSPYFEAFSDASPTLRTPQAESNVNSPAFTGSVESPKDAPKPEAEPKQILKRKNESENAERNGKRQKDGDLFGEDAPPTKEEEGFTLSSMSFTDTDLDSWIQSTESADADPFASFTAPPKQNMPPTEVSEPMLTSPPAAPMPNTPAAPALAPVPPTPTNNHMEVEQPSQKQAAETSPAQAAEKSPSEPAPVIQHSWLAANAAQPSTESSRPQSYICPPNYLPLKLDPTPFGKGPFSRSYLPESLRLSSSSHSSSSLSYSSNVPQDQSHAITYTPHRSHSSAFSPVQTPKNNVNTPSSNLPMEVSALRKSVGKNEYLQDKSPSYSPFSSVSKNTSTSSGSQADHTDDNKDRMSLDEDVLPAEDSQISARGVCKRVWEDFQTFFQGADSSQIAQTGALLNLLMSHGVEIIDEDPDDQKPASLPDEYIELLQQLAVTSSDLMPFGNSNEGLMPAISVEICKKKQQEEKDNLPVEDNCMATGRGFTEEPRSDVLDVVLDPMSRSEGVSAGVFVSLAEVLMPHLRGMFHPGGETSEAAIGPLDLEQLRNLSVSGRGQILTQAPMTLLPTRTVDLETLSVPNLIINYQDEVIRVNPLSFCFWEKTRYAPYYPKKNINYYVISPHSDSMLMNINLFFKELSAVYEVCNLGKHKANTMHSKYPGIVSIPIDFDENNDSSVDQFFSRLDQECDKIASHLIEHSLSYTEYSSSVIYAVNPFPSGNVGLARRLLRGLSMILKKVDSHPSVHLTFQIVPIQCLMQRHDTLMLLKEICFSVFNKSRRISADFLHTNRNFGAQNTNPQPKTKVFEPLSILSSKEDGQEAEGVPISRVLHCSYLFSDDNRYAVAAITDDRGEMLDTLTSPVNHKEPKPFNAAFKKFWNHCRLMTAQMSIQWRVVIGKLGFISNAELTEWKQLIGESLDKVLLTPQSQYSGVHIVSICYDRNMQVFDLFRQQSEVSAENSGEGDSFAFFPPQQIIYLDNRMKDQCVQTLGSSFIVTPPALPYNSSQSGSTWSSGVKLLVNLYFTNYAKESIEQTLRTITVQFHALSWLSSSPLWPTRESTLPFHFAVAKRLARLLSAEEVA
eukprot:TRINITY_DN5722_c0_g1_i1.p1 TRINITY_DN5722_c0_g1~~TRINITY_DN5722_c0_g1_i1.p1  ORF type:complete len:1451 (+),score=370.80 TRINITY_DN5722_c0_g1_i1:123-4475(+)